MRPALHDRKREVVDRAQEQLAQHVERLLFEDSVERAIDVLFVDDLAGSNAALKKLRRNVERDDFVGRLQKRQRNDFADRIADECLGRRARRFRGAGC